MHDMAALYVRNIIIIDIIMNVSSDAHLLHVALTMGLALFINSIIVTLTASIMTMHMHNLLVHGQLAKLFL